MQGRDKECDTRADLTTASHQDRADTEAKQALIQNLRRDAGRPQCLYRKQATIRREANRMQPHMKAAYQLRKMSPQATAVRMIDRKSALRSMKDCE